MHSETLNEDAGRIAEVSSQTTGEIDERCAEAGTVVGDGRSEIENVQVVTLKGVTAAMRPATVWLIVHRCCDNVRHDWLSKSQREA